MEENKKVVANKVQEEKAEDIKVSQERDIEAELKAKYPKVYRVDVELEEVEKEFVFYFKKPSTLSFNRVLKTLSKKSLEAMKAFTLECLVDEQRSEYEATIEEYPALPMPTGQKLLGILGVTDNVTLKKL